MSGRKYPDLFYRFALSGRCSCKRCGNKVREGQSAFEWKGNVYHDICSQNLEGREKVVV